ncbi:MAG: peptide-methionine (R)-S-oxide reductase MsrB [Eubacteriales bacterium]
MSVIYLAGGCFWGMEKLMKAVPGVISVVSGYANGNCEQDAVYEKVCRGKTGFREAVQVEYDPQKISLDAILSAFFYIIDPTVKKRQGNDIGDQYQTGIYYVDDDSKAVVERIAALEAERYSKFEVEMKPLSNFYPAEEYHQNYLEKNPNGYCHIPEAEIEVIAAMLIDAGQYIRPPKEIIKEKLTEEQYYVTQKNGTERPFSNAYHNKFEKGIYVDIVTGEPLFSSEDKFQSSCGWPAFSDGIEESVFYNIKDTSHGMVRTEVRSRSGNSHLGHVFTGDSESPSGVRYCINSAALRFVSYDEMEKEGYGYLKTVFEK